MIDFQTAMNYYGCNTSLGQRRKSNSDMIMDASWDGDIQSRIAYLYDYYHDDEPELNYRLNPQNSCMKVPVDIKYMTNTYTSDDKAQVSHHIQFKPSYKCNVDYYDEIFAVKCGAEYPLGLYIDIPDEKNVYRRFLIAFNTNIYENQFPSWSVFPCDEKINWVSNGNKHSMWAVKRSISNYDSGVWRDSKIESVNDQQKFIVPFNDISATLFYNQRIIMSAPMVTPLTWRVSKVDNLNPRGINKITLLQDKFDQHKDYIEVDNDGHVISMWADYYTSCIEPVEQHIQENTAVTSEIIYNGTKAILKVGGSSRRFTVKYYDTGGFETVPEGEIEWQFYINGENAENLLEITEIDAFTKEIKFIGDEDYIHEILKIVVENNGKSTSLDVEIAGM